jgi:adiponectin receptor
MCACSHLGGFFLFLYLAVAKETGRVAAAAARAAPSIVTFVLTSANASWETRSGNSVSNATKPSNFLFRLRLKTFSQTIA